MNVPPNKEMQLTKRGSLAGGPAALAVRRAIFIESRFAADLRCSADTGAGSGSEGE